MLVNDIKLGLAVFGKGRIYYTGRKSREIFNLKWSNQLFNQQFELKPDCIEDGLNRRIFKDYLKGPNGNIDKR